MAAHHAPFEHSRMMSEIELQKVWLDLKKAIEEIQQRCTSKHMSYVDLYRYSYELVINQKGNQLYTNLKCVVSKHLTEIVRKRILEHQGSMLHIVIKEWAEHQVIMSMIRDILLYLDCVFVPEHYLGDIFDVGVVIFKEKIIDHPDINENFVRCVLEMVANDRAGSVVDKTAIKNALQMLVNLGINSLQCYEQNFEQQFLIDSFEFYRSVYSEYISKGDIMEYIETAQKLIQDEKKRAEMYMIKNTQEKVSNLVEGELIQSHMTEIIEGKSRA
ncbi:cullin-3-B-like [Cloeon dipterum]|uniref:cullin-3-B-like n=1 Tax=Cloeon dipterum TaxID=197152 RepID=UPI00321F8FB8